MVIILELGAQKQKQTSEREYDSHFDILRNDKLITAYKLRIKTDLLQKKGLLAGLQTSRSTSMSSEYPKTSHF